VFKVVRSSGEERRKSGPENRLENENTWEEKARATQEEE